MIEFRWIWYQFSLFVSSWVCLSTRLPQDRSSEMRSYFAHNSIMIYPVTYFFLLNLQSFFTCTELKRNKTTAEICVIWICATFTACRNDALIICRASAFICRSFKRLEQLPGLHLFFWPCYLMPLTEAPFMSPFCFMLSLRSWNTF